MKIAHYCFYKVVRQRLLNCLESKRSKDQHALDDDCEIAFFKLVKTLVESNETN